MSVNYLRAGILFAFFAVALGAFGAHGLKSIVDIDKIRIFETGVRYQFYHSFALLALGLVMLHKPNNQLRIAGQLFIVGILCFSGSLYLLALREVMSLGGLVGVLGPVTPVGGVLFLSGWILFYMGVTAKR